MINKFSCWFSHVWSVSFYFYDCPKPLFDSICSVQYELWATISLNDPSRFALDVCLLLLMMHGCLTAYSNEQQMLVEQATSDCIDLANWANTKFTIIVFGLRCYTMTVYKRLFKIPSFNYEMDIVKSGSTAYFVRSNIWRMSLHKFGEHNIKWVPGTSLVLNSITFFTLTDLFWPFFSLFMNSLELLKWTHVTVGGCMYLSW